MESYKGRLSIDDIGEKNMHRNVKLNLQLIFHRMGYCEDINSSHPV